jgi:glycosyltransferase involved in cell wall biosynthesis
MNVFRPVPDQVEFLLLSFEGPDPYSQAGGLGVRITNMANWLACAGYQTHLLFIGSPDLPGRESRLDGCLQLYRWCQWISRFHPLGVYDGEESKLNDFNQSAPPFIVDHIARPAITQGRRLVVLAEEWHTAEALIRLSDQLHTAGLRADSILLWNANNTKGFDRIDWKRLDFVSSLTTVSRYMKQIMRGLGLDPLVIPNGIPADLIQPVSGEQAGRIHDLLAGTDGLLLFKVARYDPDKCWLSAIEAAARLKQNGANICFLCRGGIEAHGAQVLDQARASGLTVAEVGAQPKTWDEAIDAILAAGPADVYDLRFPMTPPMLRMFYAAADFVLANSKHEPFGLVGLEAMAAGGVVITGCTGETYSTDGAGAIALDTGDAAELVLMIEFLRDHPQRSLAIRKSAPLVASRYTWDRIFDILFEKIILAGEHQGVHSFQAADSPLAEQENQNALVGICTPVELSFPVWPVGTAVKPAVHPAAEPVWGG